MRGRVSPRAKYYFDLHKWPKKHEYVIEECECLNVRDVLMHLPAYNAQNLIPWDAPGIPYLRLVPGRGGIFIKWWLQCLSCGSKCENLFIPPDGRFNDWRCRGCHSLVYASQRYGKRHELRKVLTPRKRIAREKEEKRQRQVFDRQQKEQKKLSKENDFKVDDKFIHMMQEMEKFVAAGGTITLVVDTK